MRPFCHFFRYVIQLPHSSIENLWNISSSRVLLRSTRSRHKQILFDATSFSEMSIYCIKWSDFKFLLLFAFHFENLITFLKPFSFFHKYSLETITILLLLLILQECSLILHDSNLLQIKLYPHDYEIVSHSCLKNMEQVFNNNQRKYLSQKLKYLKITKSLHFAWQCDKTLSFE